MTKPCKGSHLAVMFLFAAAVVTPLVGQTWQQQYCTAPTTPPGMQKCINKCLTGYHSDGPLYTPGSQQNPNQPEPLCKCVLNSKTPLIPATQSAVHIHSVDLGYPSYQEIIVDSGPPYEDTTGNTVPDQPVVSAGEQIALTGCNFGQAGTLGILNTAGDMSSFPVAPTNNTPQPWSDTQIRMTVPAALASQPWGAAGSVVAQGLLEVEAKLGNSNEVTFLVSCPQPAVANATPASTTPGGTVQIRGCGLTGSNGRTSTVTLQSTGTVISTQSGPAPESIAVTSVSSATNTGITFQVPASAPTGTYNIAVDGTASTVPISVVAASSPSLGTSAAFAVGSYDPQAQQFNASGNVFQYTFFPLTAVTTGISPPAPQVWASLNTAATVPVLVANDRNNSNAALPVPLEVWQDQVPVQCDPHGPADTSPDGNAGHWVEVANPPQVAAGTGETSISVPVTLNPGVNYVTLGGQTGISNYGTEAAENCTGCSNQIHQAAAAFTCNTTAAPYTNANSSSSAYPNNMIGQWVQEIDVLPMYTVTLDAVPYSILYEPPGNQSTSNVNQAVTTTTLYKIGGGTKTSNSASDANETCWALSLAVAGVGPSTQNCNSQTIGSSSDFAGQWTGSTLYSLTSTSSWPIGKVTSLVPSPDPSWPGSYSAWGDTYANEPFWYDGFVFLLNPQYAVYNNAGTAEFMLTPQGNTQLTTAPVTVAFLAACAAGLKSPTGPGFPAQGNPCALGNNISLTSQEALNALNLDPFYPGGQSTDPTQGCTGSTCRVQPVADSTSCCYQEDTLNPVGIQYTLSTQHTSETDTNVAYTATGSNVQKTTVSVAAKESGPLSLGPSGGTLTGNANGSVQQTSTQTQGVGITVNYLSATILTSQQSTGVQVTLLDLDNTFPPGATASKILCQQCHAPLLPPPYAPFTVDVYQDSLFGTLLFRTPGAPPAPAGVTAQAEIRKLLPTIMQQQQPFLIERKVYAAPPRLMIPKAQIEQNSPSAK